MIAGETATAYHEIVTISMVSARAIRIGAYLVRLGQRVVQVDNSSIILTGAPALNKLLGREVYSSNTQLGGTYGWFEVSYGALRIQRMRVDRQMRRRVVATCA